VTVITNTHSKTTEAIIGAAIDAHRKLGPGLLESAYRECLAREFVLRGIAFEREVAVPVVYKGVHLECGYRIDFLVSGIVALEVKSVEAVAPVHEAQLITYLSLGGWNLGLLINFNVVLLKDGVRRRVLNLQE
jgi:GxxExxY protein